MDDRNNRNTFLPLRDILVGAAKRCLVVEADLTASASHADEPVSLAWREMAQEEHRLAKLILDFASRGSGNLLDTRFQYTLDETLDETAQNRPRSPEQAAAQLVNVNHDLTESLHELSVNMGPQELAESLGQLHREVESVAQNISMISTTLRDM